MANQDRLNKPKVVQFKARVWKISKAAIGVTIPSKIRKGYFIELNDILEITAIVHSKDVVKRIIKKEKGD